MYVLNTLLRLTRFFANTFLGLVVGFVLGFLVRSGTIADVIGRIISL